MVVADKVLDVPLIRQEQSQWCWAACAQMVVKKYRPNDSHSQTDMARIGQQLDEDQMPSDDDNNYHAIERIVSNCTDNTVSLIHKTDSNFTENDLRTQLNAGSPVIYLSSRYSNSGTRTGGHFRVIYGYYWLESANKYVYLVHEPYDRSDFHLDIWERSWANIMDEEASGVSNIDRPVSDSNIYYRTTEFLYFSN